MEEGASTVKKVFQDFLGRRTSIVKALTLGLSLSLSLTFFNFHDEFRSPNFDLDFISLDPSPFFADAEEFAYFISLILFNFHEDFRSPNLLIDRHSSQMLKNSFGSAISVSSPSLGPISQDFASVSDIGYLMRFRGRRWSLPVRTSRRRMESTECVYEGSDESEARACIRN